MKGEEEWTSKEGKGLKRVMGDEKEKTEAMLRPLFYTPHGMVCESSLVSLFPPESLVCFVSSLCNSPLPLPGMRHAGKPKG